MLLPRLFIGVPSLVTCPLPPSLPPSYSFSFPSFSRSLHRQSSNSILRSPQGSSRHLLTGFNATGGGHVHGYGYGHGSGSSGDDAGDGRGGESPVHLPLSNNFMTTAGRKGSSTDESLEEGVGEKDVRVKPQPKDPLV